MLTKFLKRVWKNEKGITGLETAIILIAFVVVAAVFAYTVLSAGLFSTQKSSQAVYNGLQQAQSSLEIKGSIVAKAETTGDEGDGACLSQLTFTVSNALGGDPIDLALPTADTATGLVAAGSDNKMVISYVDSDTRVQDLYWTADELNGDGDQLLDPGEKFQITIGDTTAGAGAGNLVDALTSTLVPNHTFTIELKYNNGAVLSFERTTPPYIDAVDTLNS
jgi:archaeal flagellin FlaB